MPAAAPERLQDDVSRLAHSGAGVRDFSSAAARIVGRVVPLDGFCMLTVDPATHLPTSEVVIEVRGEDFNTFTALERSGRYAASLSESTRGDLDRSVRHRELKRPGGSRRAS